MWCRACQQDVPGLSAPGDAAVRCARCHAAVSSRIDPAATLRPPHPPGLSASSLAAVPQGAAQEVSPRSPRFQRACDVEDDLRAADRLIRHLRLHAQHNVHPRDPAATTSATPPPGANEPPQAGDGLMSALARALLAASFSLFGVGAVMVGWSLLATDQAIVWRYGMPLALAGQAGLVLGLAVHMAAEWRRERAKNDLLDRLDGQLRQLRAEQPAPGAASSLSARIAAGASPHLLLADLQSQIEQLAQRLKDQRPGSTGDRGSS